MAARGLGTLTLDLIAKIGGFTGPMDEAARKAQKSGKDIAGAADGAAAAWKELGPVVAGAFAGLSAASVFAAFITNTKAMEQEQAQLEAALKSTGGAAGYSSEQLNSMAEAMSNASTFSGGEINTAQTALLAFTGIAGEEFKKATQSAIDMAARTGMSVVSAAETIGRALDVPSRGMAALSKQGFRFTDDQKALAKSLEDSGQTAEAQGIILQELQKTYDGAAEAARDTFGGALVALGNTLADITTGDKDSLAAAKAAVEGLISALKSPAGKVAIEALAASAVALSVVLTTRVAASAVASAVSFAVAQKEAIRYQMALSTMAGLSTRAAVGIAAAGAAARVASASMALLGGPAGIVILAATALTYFATRASETEIEAEALQNRINALGGSFDTLSSKQAAAALIDYNQQLVAAKYAAIEAEVKVFSLKKQIRENPRSPTIQGLTIDLIRAEAALDTANSKLADVSSSIEQLNAIASRSTIGNASDLASKTFTELAAKIQEQIDLHGKETGAAQLAARIQLGYIKDLKEGEGEKLIALQQVADAQAAGDKAQKERSAEGKRQIEQARSAAKAIADTVDKYEEQAATLGMNAEELALYKLNQDGATESQKNRTKAALAAVSAYNDQTKAIEAMKAADESTNKEAIGILDSLLSEEEQIKQSFERRRQIVMDATLLTAEQKRQALADLEEKQNEELLEINGSFWERYLQAAQDNLTNFDELAGNMLENFTGRFGDAFESMVFDAETLGEAVADLGEGMARSIVNALGEMAAQWLAYQAVQLLVGKSTQASAGIQLVANAQATAFQASLAAFASTAAIPITGPALAPAAAAAAAGLTAPMVAGVASAALSGMAHDGIDSVPETGTWLLQKGERVTTAETSAKLDSTLDRLSAESGGMNSMAPQININIKGDGSGGGVESSAGYEQLGEALLATARSEMPKIARQVIQQEKGQNGLLDPSNRRN